MVFGGDSGGKVGRGVSLGFSMVVACNLGDGEQCGWGESGEPDSGEFLEIS